MQERVRSSSDEKSSVIAKVGDPPTGIENQ